MKNTKNILTLLFLFVTISAFAQSKREWMEYADAAYKNEDYKTALSFYLKVIDKGTSVDYTRPYETKPFVKQRKVPKDSLAKDSTKNITTDPMEQYAVHQIADC